MAERPVPSTELPDAELRQSLEDRYPEEMGVDSFQVNLSRVSTRKGQFTHQELRTAFGNRLQLAAEHPDYLVKAGKTNRKLTVISGVVTELKAGQLPLTGMRRSDIMLGIRSARAALKERE